MKSQILKSNFKIRIHLIIRRKLVRLRSIIINPVIRYISLSPWLLFLVSAYRIPLRLNRSSHISVDVPKYISRRAAGSIPTNQTYSFLCYSIGTFRWMTKRHCHQIIPICVLREQCVLSGYCTRCDVLIWHQFKLLLTRFRCTSLLERKTYGCFTIPILINIIKHFFLKF
jgi:hypothetical protein